MSDNQQTISISQAYAGTPLISDSVYSILPASLRRPCDFYGALSARARDMFLLSSLVCIGGALKEPHTLWQHKITYPNLYLLIAAPPFSFKSSISDARGYVYDTMLYYRTQWQEAVKDWQMKMLAAKENKDSSFNEPRPFEHYLIVPSKTNKPTLIQQLNACPVNLMIANEGSSIFSALKAGGYSDYKDILLNAWNHEEINDQTKTGGHRVMIEKPRLSIVTTTTPNQAYHLTGVGSDGLLSRFCIYAFVDDIEILDGFTDADADVPQNAYTEARQYGGMVLERSFWRTRVVFTRSQARTAVVNINKRLKTWKIGDPDSEIYIGVLGRSMMNLARLCTIISVLSMSSEEKKHYVRDEIFEACWSILEVLLEHAYRMITVENSRAPRELIVPKPVATEETLYSRFLGLLPSEFTRTDALNIGAELGMSSGSVDGYLNRMKKKGILSSEKGIYKRL